MTITIIGNDEIPDPDDATGLQMVRTGDIDLYLSEQLPRSLYDFRFIKATDNWNETLRIDEKSSSGRFWMAIYTKIDGNYTISVQRDKTVNPGSDKYFVDELVLWLTTSSGGQVASILATSIFGMMALFACLRFFCCVNKHDGDDLAEAIEEINEHGTDSVRELFGKLVCTMRQCEVLLSTF